MSAIDDVGTVAFIPVEVLNFMGCVPYLLSIIDQDGRSIFHI